MKQKIKIFVLFLICTLTIFSLCGVASAEDYTDAYIKSIKICSGNSKIERTVSRDGNDFTTLVSSTDGKMYVTVETGTKYKVDEHAIVAKYKNPSNSKDVETSIETNKETLLSNAITANKRPNGISIEITDKAGNVVYEKYTLTVNLKAELAALQVWQPKNILTDFAANKTDYTVEISNPIDTLNIRAGNVIQGSSKLYSLTINDVSANFGDAKNSTPVVFDTTGKAQIPITISIANPQSGDEATTYNLTVEANFDNLQFSADAEGSRLNALNREFNYSDIENEYVLKIPANQENLFIYGVQKGNGAVSIAYGEQNISGKYGFVELPGCLAAESKDNVLTITSGGQEYKVRIIKTVALDSFSVKHGETELIAGFDPSCLNYETVVPADCSSVTVALTHSDSYDVKINGGISETVELQWDDQNEAEILVEVSYNETSSRYKLTLIKEAEGIEPILREEPADVSYNVGDAAEALVVKAFATHGGTLTYQWQSKGEDDELNNIWNEISESYTPDTRKAGEKWVRCKITNTVDGESKECVTRWVKICINATKAETPVIKGGSLEDKTYTLGEDATFLMAETPSVNDGGKLTTQWYVSETKDYSQGVPIELESTALCFPDTTSLGVKYYFYSVTNTLQGFTATAYSDFAQITVVDERESLDGLTKSQTENNTYLINSIDDLKVIANYVKAGNNLFGYTFKMTTDIVLPVDWEPIGVLKSGATDAGNGKNIIPFSGTIDGDSHKLTVSEDGLPLLGYVRQATVKNLDIYGKKIAGYGLVNNYEVDYAGGDTDADFKSRYLYTATIENVRILSGTQILKSGFIGGYASGANKVYIRNCEVQDNVIIGYDGQQSGVGSLAGEFNGIVLNCTSKATVKGVNNVGGLIGRKGQSMGDCSVTNSSFEGTIIASGIRAGGIVGSGYTVDSAPNTKCVTIKNCFVNAEITANDYVGGILGAEPVCKQCWENGAGYIQDNHFVGNIKSDGTYVGGIIGHMNSLDKYNIITNNYYISDNGPEKGIGYVNADNVDLTSEKYGRSDDPLGADSDKLTQGLSGKAFKAGNVLKKLNNSDTSLKNWIQGENYPVHSSEPVLYAIELSGTYKTEYVTGDAFSTDGMVITGKVSDGSTKNIALDDSKLKFTGFQSSKRGVQTITVTYGAAEATYEVTVLYNESQVKDISVYFTLLGDSLHGEPTAKGGPHTLSGGNLDEWIRTTEVTITNNTTVYDVLQRVLTANGITWKENSDSGTAYIENITRNGVTLGEFDNGNLSGWMYTINGVHPSLGVEEKFLNNGDRIVFHYTDDYTKEQGAENWGVPVQPEEKTEVTTGGAAGAATTTTPTEVTVAGNKATATVTKENAAETLKQAAENKSEEIVLQVSANDTKGAAKVEVKLDTQTVKDIVEDTNAALTVKTELGNLTLDRETLTKAAAEAKGAAVEITFTKSEDGTVQVSVLSGDAVLYTDVLGEDEAMTADEVKAMLSDLTPVARSSKTANKNIKVTVKLDKADKAIIEALEADGLTVKYNFYRSTKKASKYSSKLIKEGKTYTNTKGKKGQMYYYKVRVQVYDEDGSLIARTALKQCKYANRKWTK